jgi:hypothetical protein
MKIKLPDRSGRLQSFSLNTEPLKAKAPKAPFNRVAFAAAHVVADPLKGGALPRPWTLPSAAWDLIGRRHLN